MSHIHKFHASSAYKEQSSEERCCMRCRADETQEKKDGNGKVGNNNLPEGFKLKTLIEAKNFWMNRIEILRNETKKSNPDSEIIAKLIKCSHADDDE